MTLLSTGSYNVELCEQTMFIILSAGPNAQTDASSYNQPSGTSPARDANGRVSYYEEVNDVDERKWRSKLGRWLYEDIVKKELARRGIGDPHPVKVYLATFPLHYKLWKKRTGKSLDPRQDAYLWGSRFVREFRSPAEFRLHLKWIVQGQPMKSNNQPDCECCYCDPSRTQGEISEALGMFHPNPHKKEGDKRGSGQRRVPQPAESITYKDYTKLRAAPSS